MSWNCVRKGIQNATRRAGVPALLSQPSRYRQNGGAALASRRDAADCFATFPGCRFTQPGANRCDASGIGKSVNPARRSGPEATRLSLGMRQGMGHMGFASQRSQGHGGLKSALHASSIQEASALLSGWRCDAFGHATLKDKFFGRGAARPSGMKTRWNLVTGTG